jgi:hypothetical protein
MSSSTAHRTSSNRNILDEGIGQLHEALRNHSKHYEIKAVAPNSYHLECGDLCGNIMLGCFMQYYAYQVDVVSPKHLSVESTVPCGGFWGGAIGVAKNNRETKEMNSLLQNAFRQGIITYQEEASAAARKSHGTAKKEKALSNVTTTATAKNKMSAPVPQKKKTTTMKTTKKVAAGSGTKKTITTTTTLTTIPPPRADVRAY